MCRVRPTAAAGPEEIFGPVLTQQRLGYLKDPLFLRMVYRRVVQMAYRMTLRMAYRMFLRMTFRMSLRMAYRRILWLIRVWVICEIPGQVV